MKRKTMKSHLFFYRTWINASLCFPKEKREESKRNLGQIWKQMPHPSRKPPNRLVQRYPGEEMWLETEGGPSAIASLVSSLPLINLQLSLYKWNLSLPHLCVQGCYSPIPSAHCASCLLSGVELQISALYGHHSTSAAWGTSTEKWELFQATVP